MFKIFFLILLSLSLFSCSLLKKQGTWGKNAFYPLKGGRIADAFIKNASSAHVWVPLAGAGLVHWGGFDHKISDWAKEGSGIYEDQTAADIWSDHFNNILKYEMYVTTLLTPSMPEDKSFGQYAFSKIKGGVVVSLSSTSTRWAHGRIATAAHRQRPNKIDYRSFPSGHATEASSRNRLVSKNLDAIDMDPNLRLGINSINTTMSIGTLWARLEGKRHYPSDVLVGYSLGSFLSGFIYDSLINYDANETFVLLPMKDKLTAMYTVNF